MTRRPFSRAAALLVLHRPAPAGRLVPAALLALLLLPAPPAPAQETAPNWCAASAPAPGLAPDPLVPGLYIGRGAESGVPLPPFYPPLPAAANPFAACVPVSHSIRFDASIAARNWTLTTPSSDEAAAFPLLRDAAGRPIQIALYLESVPAATDDAAAPAENTSPVPLRPERFAREGGHFALRRGTARAFTGTADSGTVEWLLALEKSGNGRWIVQGRLRLTDQARTPRFYRLRLAVLDAPAARPLPSADAPAAVFSVRPSAAVALCADLSEPRRLRVLPDFRPTPDAAPAMAIEFDLALTPLTRNFPSRASFSAILSTWTPSADPAAEALARLPRARVPATPDFQAAVEAYAHSPALTNFVSLAALDLRAPLPFLSPGDALDYLRFRASSSLFPDAAALAPAIPSLAIPAAAVLSPNDPARATIPLNPDPDIETPLLLGSNWGKTLFPRLLALARKQGGLSVEIAFPDHLDASPNALAMADYPAVWDPAAPAAPLVLLAHPQCEFLAALACALHEEDLPLAVCDPSPHAPFTTYHADIPLP